MNTPTPRTDNAEWLTGRVTCDFARTLEELHESCNAERLARVQLGNERARLDELISANATGAARLAHATAQLAAEREKVRVLRLACERLRDCDWVISLPDRMDAVRDIARAALAATEDAP
jgi:hypothetical protein